MMTAIKNLIIDALSMALIIVIVAGSLILVYQVLPKKTTTVVTGYDNGIVYDPNAPNEYADWGCVIVHKPWVSRKYQTKGK